MVRRPFALVVTLGLSTRNLASSFLQLGFSELRTMALVRDETIALEERIATQYGIAFDFGFDSDYSIIGRSF